LLFRSASEGSRTTSCNDPLTKYSVLSKKEVAEDVKNSSFRSTDSIGSSRRRSGPISAHEVHYTVNRAVSEEMKRKTFLPYKQGLLGCLGFNRAASVHEISRGVRSLTRGWFRSTQSGFSSSSSFVIWILMVSLIYLLYMIIMVLCMEIRHN
jgi:hypothetical protein